MEALIVGIDPGSTSAVAAVNLDGELRILESRKEYSQHEIITTLIENGRPVIVATDRENIPATVEKIAASLGANRFEPEEDLEKQKKYELGTGENSHEIDAMAAAMHALKQHHRHIRKINKKADETEADREDLAYEYFSGQDIGFRNPGNTSNSIEDGTGA